MKENRTFDNGILGINLHSDHISEYHKSRIYYENIDKQYILLRRADEIAQAVSYYIALRTKKWSSHFPSQGRAEYNYRGIYRCWRRIVKGNLLALSYLAAERVDYTTIHYEEIADGKVDKLSTWLDADLAVSTRLQKQGSSQNREFAERFAVDLFENHKDWRMATKRIGKAFIGKIRL